MANGVGRSDTTPDPAEVTSPRQRIAVAESSGLVGGRRTKPPRSPSDGTRRRTSGDGRYGVHGSVAVEHFSKPTSPSMVLR